MAVAISRTADPAGAGSGTTITYSGVSIGAAEDSRIVVVCVGTELNSGTPSSATLNGAAMNSTALASFGAMGARIFWLPAPSGTTADIAVTFGASQGATTQHLCVYRVVGAAVESTGTNTSTDMDSTAPLTTGSLTIRSSGGFIGIAVGATDAVGKTWANATEDLDEDAGTFQFTTATRATALSATAITCTGGTNAEDGALAWLLLRPGVTADAGAFVLTGSAATLVKGHPLSAGAGAYSLTGTSATLRHNYPLVAGAGSLALTGAAATPIHAWKASAAAGSFALNGAAAAPLHGWKVTAAAGSFALTGANPALLAARQITGGVGSFTLAGAAAALTAARRIAAGEGLYAINGADAALIKEGGNLTLAADAGAFTLSGSLVTLQHAWIVTSAAGSYLLTGAAASLEIEEAPRPPRTRRSKRAGASGGVGGGSVERSSLAGPMRAADTTTTRTNRSNARRDARPGNSRRR